MTDHVVPILELYMIDYGMRRICDMTPITLYSLSLCKVYKRMTTATSYVMTTPHLLLVGVSLDPCLDNLLREPNMKIITVVFGSSKRGDQHARFYKALSSFYYRSKRLCVYFIRLVRYVYRFFFSSRYIFIEIKTTTIIF